MEKKAGEEKVAAKTYIVCVIISLSIAAIAIVISKIIFGLGGPESSGGQVLEPVIIGVLAGAAYYVSFMMSQKMSKKKK
ncbi:MAG: hypothetical protein FWG14_10215 [Peptococcaceae bacterium]|nr:hypothetical protein [Peptococcaceae bacterium]